MWQPHYHYKLIIMSKAYQIVLLFCLSFSCIRGHIIWESPNDLHPVRGLYVKPSIDGTTGDLYVAATEDNGIKSKWLTDQPINFLPAASKLQPKIAPLSLSSSLTKKISPKEEVITTEKRAVMTSPPVKYAYALPIPGPEGNIAYPYPYPYPMPAFPPTETPIFPPCSPDIPTQPYPFHYFYPHMMSAIASAMHSFKESESNEDSPSFLPPMPYWPQGYGYPYQYIMLDPNAWAQNQSIASSLEASNNSSGESI